jgi:hypothetical protein
MQTTATPYTAASIRILSDAEVVDRFDWAKVGALAVEYKRDEGWIRRGLAACETAGVSADYFIDRYLRKLPIPKHDGVEAAFWESMTNRTR